MTYRVTLSPSAERQLRKFDPQARRRIQAAIELLAVEPRPPAATRLVGGGSEWRVRTGDYRIIYEINDEELVLLVLRVGHRRDIYQGDDRTATFGRYCRCAPSMTSRNDTKIELVRNSG